MSLRSVSTFFSSLIPPIISGLRRIVDRTRGGATVGDLQIEAWLVTEKLSQDREPPPDVGGENFHRQILGCLYNRFVRSADKHLRDVVRIDEQCLDDDGAIRENSTAAALAARDDPDPSKAMEAWEGEHKQELAVLGHFTEAVAYLHILTSMRNDRYTVAAHLVIAVNTLHNRMKHTEWVVRLQPFLLDGIVAVPSDFMPSCHSGHLPAVVTTSGKHRPPAFLTQLKLFVRTYIPMHQL